MPNLAAAGRIAIAETLFSQPLHLAWGTGDGVWTSTVPPVSGTETALRAEIGRRQATQVQYVVPDAVGSIVLPEGRFSPSSTPTRSLYIRTDFDFSEATGAAIREVGLFVRTVIQAGLPAGQRYFTPSQVTNPGRLLHLKNFQPIYRFPNNRERFEIVMTF